MNAQTVTQWWNRVGFEQPADVERRLVVGTFVGALVAGVAVLLETTTHSSSTGTSAVCAALLALVVALPSHSRALMALLSLGLIVSLITVGVTAARAPWVLSAALGVTLAVESQARWWRRALALVGPAVGVWCFLFVVRWLSARHLGAGAAAGAVVQLTAGLFVSAGAALAQLTVAVDAVEPRLRFDAKVREVWVRLHGALKRVPEAGARQKLKDVANLVASRWLDARLEQRDAETVDEERAAEARDAVERLEARLQDTEDAELRRHFEQSLRVHRDVLEQLEGLNRKSERAAARARAEADWLENAVFTLELTPPAGNALTDAVDRLAVLARRAA